MDIASCINDNLYVYLNKYRSITLEYRDNSYIWHFNGIKNTINSMSVRKKLLYIISLNNRVGLKIVGNINARIVEDAVYLILLCDIYVKILDINSQNAKYNVSCEIQLISKIMEAFNELIDIRNVIVKGYNLKIFWNYSPVLPNYNTLIVDLLKNINDKQDYTLMGLASPHASLYYIIPYIGCNSDYYPGYSSILNIIGEDISNFDYSDHMKKLQGLYDKIGNTVNLCKLYNAELIRISDIVGNVDY